MEQPVEGIAQHAQPGETRVWEVGGRTMVTTALLLGLCVALMALPTPTGLSRSGHRVLAVVALAIGLWCTETLPMGVTSILVVMALMLSGGVAGFPEALIGFAQPVAYFLIGVLTIGLAVLRSGLAGRVAWFFLRRSPLQLSPAGRSEAFAPGKPLPLTVLHPQPPVQTAPCRAGRRFGKPPRRAGNAACAASGQRLPAGDAGMPQRRFQRGRS